MSDFIGGVNGLTYVGVIHALGDKCVRCLRWVEAGYGTDPQHPQLCLRCTEVVVAEFDLVDGKLIRKNK